MKNALLFVLLALPFAGRCQTGQPTKQETVNYIRTKLLSLCDQENFSEISFSQDNCTMVLKWLSFGTTWTSEVFISNLDANSFTWEIKNQSYLVLTISTKAGSNLALTRTNDNSAVGGRKTILNTFRIEFNLSKASDTPDFQARIGRAFKRAIELCGGEKEKKDPFEQ